VLHDIPRLFLKRAESRDVAKHLKLGECRKILPEIWTSILKIYLKCKCVMIIIELFLINFHCHTISFRRKGRSGGFPPENVYIFEAPGLHFWRSPKQIRKRIGSKWTVFYKNGYHFTKITSLWRKFYLKMSLKFKLEFYQPRSQGLSFCHLGETLAAAGHVPPRFWEVNLIVTVRGMGKERVCSVFKLQLCVMK
jgi:hypothetical protein